MTALKKSLVAVAVVVVLVAAGGVLAVRSLLDPDHVRRTLEQHKRADAPCAGPLPVEKGTTWVEPLLVCEVEYSERTDEDLLRQPVFLRFRDDKKPEECVRPPDGRRSAVVRGAAPGEAKDRGGSRKQAEKIPRAARDDR